MQPTSIVILTPGQLGSNPRVVKEANALHMAGYDVRVIATKVADFVEVRDQEILGQAPWPVDRIAFNRPWLWRRERLLQETAKRVRPWLLDPRIEAIASSAMTRCLTRAALNHKADLYIAHYPAALIAAASAAQRHGSLFAFDAEDFHTGDFPESPEHDAARALICSIEARYLPDAAYITAASSGIADAYEATYGVALPTVVRNVFSKYCAPPTPSPKGTARGPSRYWFSQTIGPDRGLECAIAAIAQADTRPHLYLRGTPQAGYEDRLNAVAGELGCADRLHFLKPEAPSRMVELASSYDLGLVGETGVTKNRRIALTNKQFTYLLAGVPAVMSDIPAHIPFACETKRASFLYRTENPASLAVLLDSLFCDPDQLARDRATAFRFGQNRFNWEREMPRLLAKVRAVLRPIKKKHYVSVK